MAIPTSIVDYLKSTGQPSDFASRSALAASKGIRNYAGTAEQNTRLLGILRTPAPAAPVTPKAPQAPTTPTPQPIPSQPAPASSPAPVTPQPVPPAPSPVPSPVAPAQPPVQPPAPAPVVAPTPSPAQTYVVQPGDTLSAIAGRLGVPISAISGYRSGDPNRIFAGETLTVGQAQAPQAPQAPQVPQIPQAPSVPSPETPVIPPTLTPEQTSQRIKEIQDQLAPLQEKVKTIRDAEAKGLEVKPTTTYEEAAGFLEGYGVKVDAGKAITNPPGSWQDTYQDLFKNLGLDKVKENIDSTISKIEALDKEEAEKAAVINDNPWISEAQRSREISRLSSEYEGKKKGLTSALSLYQDTYKQGRDEAQFLVSTALTQYNAERKFGLDEQKLLADQAEAKAKAIADLKKINPAVYKEVRGGLYNVETGEWVIPAKAGADVADLLSPTEAAALGVPYGTTKSEAAGLGITPERPATEAQRTIATYAARLEQSIPQIKNLEDTIKNMNIALFSSQIKLPSTFQSADIQKYMQSSRNFINAVLRRESGAVISPSEFAEARQQYLPQPGDSKDVLSQKEANRNIVFQSLKKASGPAFTSVEELLGTPSLKPATSGETSSGVKWKVEK